jgi:hypothetical protein
VADWGAVKEAVLKKGSAEAGTLLSVLWWRLIIDNPNVCLDARSCAATRCLTQA